jgi:hypothetical protein
MVEQNNNGCCEYANKYIFVIRRLADMIECKDNAVFVSSLREDFGKLGLFSSAANFLRLMYEIRASSEDKETLRSHISVMAMEALLTLSWYIVSDYNDIIESQIELFKTKNKRYGNAFSECFAKDGYPYAFGHLQEKINRICSLLTLRNAPWQTRVPFLTTKT